MVLTNATAFAVLKILRNLVSMQKSLFANNCSSKHNYEKCPMWRNFLFLLNFQKQFVAFWKYV